MNLAEHPAGETLHYLSQGLRLIDRLDDETWVAGMGAGFRGGIGSQLRHCLDFFDCFLRGLPGGRIDYSDRRRDPDVERDRGHASARVRETIGRLELLEDLDLDAALRVKSDESTLDGVLDAWSDSSVRRELQFLVSHTIHHYALIVALLARHGDELPEGFADFGVAPSTLRHWKDTGPVVQ